MSIINNAINATAIALFATEYTVKTMYHFLIPSYGVPEKSPMGFEIIERLPLEVAGFSSEYDDQFQCGMVKYTPMFTTETQYKVFVSKKFGKFNRFLIKMAILHEEGHYLDGSMTSVRSTESELSADMNAIRNGNRIEKLAFGGFLVYSLVLSTGSRGAINENTLRLKQLWSNL